jgi:catechol 2,3-dioxygenase-like lactoylglutathione lyase family enzyme
MEHVGAVVDDLQAATEFFVALGLKVQGEAPVGGAWVDRVIGLEGVQSDIVYLQTPDGHGHLELSKFHSPASQDGSSSAPSNARGLRHISFLVDDIDAAVAGLRSRGTELVGGQLSALLRPRSGGNHRGAGGGAVMKITVMGASGLIGSKVVALLTEQGNEVVAASGQAASTS